MPTDYRYIFTNWASEFTCTSTSDARQWRIVFNDESDFPDSTTWKLVFEEDDEFTPTPELMTYLEQFKQQ